MNPQSKNTKTSSGHSNWIVYVYRIKYNSIFFCSLQVILVQVNPGEAFTIRREDGQFQCITGETSWRLKAIDVFLQKL